MHRNPAGLEGQQFLLEIGGGVVGSVGDQHQSGQRSVCQRLSRTSERDGEVASAALAGECGCSRHPGNGAPHPEEAEHEPVTQRPHHGARIGPGGLHCQETGTGGMVADLHRTGVVQQHPDDVALRNRAGEHQ